MPGFVSLAGPWLQHAKLTLTYPLSLISGGSDTGGRDCYTNLTCDYTLMTKKAEAHENFETLLCQNLRASRMSSFAQAKDCSFLIVENPGSSSTRLTEQTVYKARNHHPTGVEISLFGLGENPPADAIKFMETALLEAHNVALAKFRYGLSRFEIVSMVPSSYDDVTDAFLLFGHAIPHSERSYDPPEAQIATLYHEFEATFCNMVHMSGYTAFANVHDCTFRFVYNPAGEVPPSDNNPKKKQAAAIIESA
mgnify:CR=1 FL=1